jgi:hypothetical protein
MAPEGDLETTQKLVLVGKEKRWFGRAFAVATELLWSMTVVIESQESEGH